MTQEVAEPGKKRPSRRRSHLSQNETSKWPLRRKGEEREEAGEREREGGERESEKESGREGGGRRREREGGKEKENEAECTTFELLSQWQSTNYS